MGITTNGGAAAVADHPEWRAVALVIAGCLFVLNLDSSIIATSLPQMAASFGRRPIELSIGISAYILAGAAVVPISGWLAERFGSRRMMLASLALFTLASVACGAAQSFWPFVLARVVQGAGGSVMVPVGFAIVLGATGRERMIQAMGLVTWPSLIAPVLGPALGGFITTYLTWRWNFLLNLPLGLVLAVMIRLVLPEERGAQRRSLDLIGLALTSVAMICLLAGLDSSSGSGARTALAVGLIGVGLLLGVLAVRHLRRHPAPVVSLLPLRARTFQYGVAGPGLLFRAVFGATPFLLPLMFQLGYHLTAASAGLLVLVYFAGNLFMKIFTTGLMRRFGFRTLLIGNGLIVTLSVAWCGWLAPYLPRDLLTVALFVAGATRSLQFTALSTLGFADIPAEQKNDAATLSSLIIQASFAVGIALTALALNLAQARHGDGGPTPGDFRLVFMLLGAASLLATVGFTRLPGDAGAALRQGA